MNIECECGNTFSVDEGRVEEVRKGPENISDGGKAAEDVNDTVYCLECLRTYSLKEGSLVFAVKCPKILWS